MILFITINNLLFVLFYSFFVGASPVVLDFLAHWIENFLSAATYFLDLLDLPFHRLVQAWV